MHSWNCQIRTWDNAAMKESGHAAASKPLFWSRLLSGRMVFCVCVYGHTVRNNRESTHTEREIRVDLQWITSLSGQTCGKASCLATVLTKDGDKDESETSRRKRSEGRVSDTKEAKNSGGSLCEEERKKKERTHRCCSQRAKKKKEQGPGRLGWRGGSAIGAHLKRPWNQEWPYLKYDEGPQKERVRTLVSSESTWNIQTEKRCCLFDVLSHARPEKLF